LPQGSLLAALRDPKNPIADSAGAELRAAAASIGQTVEIFDAESSEEITAAFTELVRRKAGGLVVIPDALFTTRMIQIVTLATRHAIPAVFPSREWAEAGGLMSYGANVSETYRQVGVYAGRILRGAKPAELPVEQSTKFEFVINLQTAKIVDLQIPPPRVSRLPTISAYHRVVSTKRFSQIEDVIPPGVYCWRRDEGSHQISVQYILRAESAQSRRPVCWVAGQHDLDGS